MEDKERPEETPAEDVEAHANAPKAGAPKADDVESHSHFGAPKAGAPKAC